MDTGCATAVRGEDHDRIGIGADPSAIGHLLETFVFTEPDKSVPFQKSPGDCFIGDRTPVKSIITLEFLGPTEAEPAGRIERMIHNDH